MFASAFIKRVAGVPIVTTATTTTTTGSTLFPHATTTVPLWSSGGVGSDRNNKSSQGKQGAKRDGPDFRWSLKLPATTLPIRSDPAATEPPRIALFDAVYSWQATTLGGASLSPARSIASNVTLMKNKKDGGVDDGRKNSSAIASPSFTETQEGLSYSPGTLSIDSATNTTRVSESGRRFTLFHDGPPYANGPPHLGHFLNHTLKDIVTRFALLRGSAISFVPGWDTHGLPIELKAIKNAVSREPVDVRAAAAAEAAASIEIQGTAFRRWGVMAEWGAPYTTAAPSYEAEQLRVFASMVDKGLITRAAQPVFWSPAAQTALAESELEYPEGHVSPAVYIALPLQPSQALQDNILASIGSTSVSPDPSWTAAPTKAPVEAPSRAGADKSTNTPSKKSVEAAIAANEAASPSPPPGSVSVLVWTTTPWTLPANKAVAYAPRETYVAVPDPTAPAERILILAESRLQDLADKVGATSPPPVLASFSGSKLEGLVATNPLCPASVEALGSGGHEAALAAATASPLLPAGHVTADSGSGLVHTAPGHGREDWALGQANGLPTFAPVDNYGRYTEEAGPALEGQQVLTDGSHSVLQAAAATGVMIASHAYAHKVPYDWRTKKPVIMRATPQWFADLSTSLIEDSKEAVTREVKVIPDGAERRLQAFLGSRDVWCISRQRHWGVPIPAFFRKDDSDAPPLLTGESVRHVADVFAAEGGSDQWWTLPMRTLLPPSIPDEDVDNWRIGQDTMDVWFDSGSSWSAVMTPRGIPTPADVYLEGSDQHRGWFQSSLLTSVAVTGGSPYRTLVTHGFTIDESGSKMSKSLGNGIDPSDIVIGKPKSNARPDGADVLRFWVSAADYTKDIAIGPVAMAAAKSSLRKIRNTARFCLGATADFPTPGPGQSVFDVDGARDGLTSIDIWMLSALSKWNREMDAAYREFSYAKVHSGLAAFSAVQCSSVYFEVVKDRLYTASEADPSRRATQAVLWLVLDSLTKVVAPLAPFTAEDLWAAGRFARRPIAAAASGAPDSVFAHAAGLPLVGLDDVPEWDMLPGAAGDAWTPGREGVDADYDGWAATRRDVADIVARGSALDEEQWLVAGAVRTEVNRLLEKARANKLVGSSLGAGVRVAAADPAVLNVLETLASSGNGASDNELNEFFVTSQVSVERLESEPEATVSQFDGDGNVIFAEQPIPGGEWGTGALISVPLPGSDGEKTAGVWVEVEKPSGHKCDRCWRVTPSSHAAKTQGGHEGLLCTRCNDVYVKDYVSQLQ